MNVVISTLYKIFYFAEFFKGHELDRFQAVFHEHYIFRPNQLPPLPLFLFSVSFLDFCRFKLLIDVFNY